MIFVSVGTQLPFDRMLKAIESWQQQSGYAGKIVAQVGANGYKPGKMDCMEYIDGADFKTYIDKCDLIISHAGMGNIIAALENDKPIIIVPRQASLGEHRNDHQIATAKRFEGKKRLFVANDEAELARAYDMVFSGNVAGEGIDLPSELGGFIDSVISEWFNGRK